MTESGCPLLGTFFDHIDTRATRYYLLSSVWKPLGIVAVYFLLIYKILPKYMEKREPYNLRKILIGYNAVQVALNALIVIYGFRSFIIHKDWFCALVDYSDSYDGERELFACYCYYLTKILDLLDTIFFLLRKNNRQVTYLHVYHHSAMVIMTWFVVRHVGGGHTLWVGFFNCLVHVMMYSYYLLTAHNESFKTNLLLKRSITQIQMVQFVLIFTMHMVAMLRPSCRFPRVVSILTTVQNIYFFYLFAQFYMNTYLKKSKIKGKSEIIGKDNGYINGNIKKDANGRSNGYSNGNSNGKIIGYSNGYSSGKINGYSNGNLNGKMNGTSK